MSPIFPPIFPVPDFPWSGLRVQMINRVTICLLTILLALTAAACSRRVDAAEVYGEYVASYPFGTEILTLQRDGNFVQRVTVQNQPPTEVKGTWRFDPKESRITLSGSMVVVDGFDKLRSDWRSVTPGVVSIDVERHWFRVLLASAQEHPYVKQ